jgi:hypothetical protein
MNQRPDALDRTLVVLVGLLLAATGAGLLGWHQGWFPQLPATLETDPAVDAAGAAWWPWAAAAVGVLLGLLGLRWLAAHVPGRGPGTLRLGGSGATGRLEVDLRGTADALAGRLTELAPVTAVRAGTREARGGAVLEIRARLEPEADADTVVAAVRTCRAELDAAFPDGEVGLRVRVSSPRRPGRRQADRVRVG